MALFAVVLQPTLTANHVQHTQYGDTREQEHIHIHNSLLNERFATDDWLERRTKDGDRHRTETDHVYRREDEQDEWEYELHAHLGRTLFGALTPFRSRRLGMNAQRLCDARAEPVGLCEHGDERAHLIHVRPFAKILERFETRFSRPDLRRD